MESLNDDEYLKYINLDSCYEGNNSQPPLEWGNQLIGKNQESERNLVLASTEEHNKAYAGRSQEVDKATMILTQTNPNQLTSTPRTAQCIQTDTTSGVETATVDRLQRKREADRAYRERLKERRRKLEEDLKASRHQNARLLAKLKSIKKSKQNGKVRASMKRLKAEMTEIREEQKHIKEGQMEIREKFEQIESECHQLKEETSLISQQNLYNQQRIKAQEDNSFSMATELTQSFHELMMKKNIDEEIDCHRCRCKRRRVTFRLSK